MDTIEWEGIEKMMNNAPPMRRTKIMQLLHNWQNTGRQKGKFRDARLRLQSDEPLEPTLEEVDCQKCPEGCDEEENELHFLECPKEHTRLRRKECIKKVLQKLKKIRTYEGIMSHVGKILNSISNREVMELDWDEIHRDGDMSLGIALMGQEEIGWDRMCQGYYHKAWTTVQGKYYRRMGKNSKFLNIGRWKKMFSTILVEYSLDCWRLRNETIHGKERDESRKKQLDTIKKQIKNLYSQKETLKGTTQYRIYDMPQKKRLGMGIQSSRIWVGMAEEVLKLHREKSTLNTIDHWLNP